MISDKKKGVIQSLNDHVHKTFVANPCDLATFFLLVDVEACRAVPVQVHLVLSRRMSNLRITDQPKHVQVAAT